MSEKWLLTDHFRTAQAWKDQLSLRGYSSINLHSKTLRSITVTLVAEHLNEQKLVFVNHATTRMLIHSVVSDLFARQRLEYFDRADSLDSVSELLANSIRDLRLSQVEPCELLDVKFESAAKARDLRLIYQSYCDRLQSERLVDYAACLAHVTMGLNNKSISLPSDLVVLIPEELKTYKAERGLLAAIASRSQILTPDVSVFSEETTRNRIVNRVENEGFVIDYFAGLGEVNEVRGVLQRVLSQKDDSLTRLDQTEIVCTDGQQYAPLILESLLSCIADHRTDEALPSIDSLPVTFAGGITCLYTRPGKALRSWVRWARNSFVQTKAVEMVREGILARPASHPEIGYARLANTLRNIPIAFQPDRYLVKIGEAIQSAKICIAEHDAQGDREQSAEKDSESASRNFGLPALEMLNTMFKPLIELAPRSQRTPIDNLKNARSFLRECARAENKLDRYAREQLIDELDGMILMLETTRGMQFDVVQWLEDLPRHCSILLSGPAPGCIHVSSIDQSGYSGRDNLFIVGLDDSRFPRRSPVDPVLLDSERSLLSPHLPTSIQQSREHQQLLYRVLDRVLDLPNLRVTLSHSVRQFSDDRECFPSPSMLDVYRASHGNLDANMDDLKKQTGRPISFVSESIEDNLIERDSVLAGFLGEQDAAARQQWLESRYEHIKRSRIAIEHAESPEFSAFDGYVPKAGNDLDPSAGLSVSSSRLETYGTCPRRFFFQRGLNVYPPTQWSVDHELWLDPLLFGNLVHELFEEFLKDLTCKGLTPSLSRDRNNMIDLLHTKIQRLVEDVPSPNADAFLRQRKQLEDMCDVFLMNEERYCNDNQATPWILESSIGLSEAPKNILDSESPVSISLSDGRVLNVNGRIDRVDKQIVEGSQRYAIWDYKSGSKHGFDQANPFNQGRKLQPFLYLGLLRHRIAATGGDADSVASFGYFFPNPNLDGLRLQWTRAELRDGDLILRNICDSIANGVFLATTNQSDCKYCDYLSVCGEPSDIASKSILKLQAADTPLLTPLRQLRETDMKGSAQHD